MLFLELRWWVSEYKSLDQNSVHSIYLVYQHVIINSIKIGFCTSQVVVVYNLYIYHFFGCLYKTFLNNKVAVMAFATKVIQKYWVGSSVAYKKCWVEDFLLKQLQLNYLDKLPSLLDVTSSCPVITWFLGKRSFCPILTRWLHQFGCNAEWRRLLGICFDFSLSFLSCVLWI